VSWIEVAALDTIPRRGARVVETPHGTIAVFRTTANEVFAIDDRCPHRGGPLSQGIVHGNEVTCPLHGLRVHLDTGRAVEPDEGCTRCHATKIEHGIVYVFLPRAPVLTGGGTSGPMRAAS
jgi:nitrite reductase (NADH) small subunit